MAADRRQADWEAIEREYRAGQLSVREVATQHGVSHTAINKKAKTEGWTRNLAQRVRDEVSSRLVSTEVSTGNANEAVETAVTRGVEVVRQHRHAISRGRDLTLRLLDELDATTSHVGELEVAIEAETAADKTGQRRAVMMKAVGLPSRAGVIKDLSAAAKNWVVLERQAFNLDDGSSDVDKPVVKVSISLDPVEASREYQRVMSGR